jgi:hypothetical protein
MMRMRVLTHSDSILGGCHKLNEGLQSSENSPNGLAHQFPTQGVLSSVNLQFICEMF